MARILGRAPGVVLTTEHSDKSGIPEDRLPVEDNQVWWDSFSFPGRTRWPWRARCEEPRPSSRGEARLRDHYARIAAGRRLVVKNPQHLVGLEILDRVLPGARYIWVIRDPWAILESGVRATRDKRRWWGSYSRHAYLRSRASLAIPDADVLARVAHGLGYMADRWGEKPGPVVRYEDLLAAPGLSIRSLYDMAGFTADIEPARALPEPNDKDTASIRAMAEASPRRALILDCVQRYCAAFGCVETAAPAADTPARIVQSA